MPLPEPTSQQLAICEILALLAGAGAGSQLTGGNPAEATTASRTAEAASRITEPETAQANPRGWVTSSAVGLVVSRGGRGHTRQCPDPQ